MRSEVASALDQAAMQLDTYSESGDGEQLKAFLEEIQQVRGTFKMLDFRAGERLCEELAETGRAHKGRMLSEQTLSVFTQAVIFLKRYIEFVISGKPVAPSLLLPTINEVRAERSEKPLPEAYFFLVNLRPQLTSPSAEPEARNFSVRRARQLYQLGLIGLIRNDGRRGPLQVMLRAVRRFEKASRSQASWPFWHVATAALEALSEDAFEMTGTRLRLMGLLDRQVRRIQDTEGRAFNEKMPDWLLKELLYIVSLADGGEPVVDAVQRTFRISSGIKEKGLAESRSGLHGPDLSALESLSQALQEELQSVKDQIDLIERTDVSEEALSELIEAMDRIGDTLLVSNLTDASYRTQQLCERLKQLGASGLESELPYLADEVMSIEQDIRGLTQENLSGETLVDPVSLNEARIAVVSESMTALTLIKRAVGSFLDSSGDKLHIKNVGKSLRDVSGALLFLENERVCNMLQQLEEFIARVVSGALEPSESQMEAFADAVTGIEYFLDSLSGQSASADDALSLASDSIDQLRA
ncbi:hypothetical protein CHH28_13995 [Bacterioplanes sanyensis]|uniref:Scaffold protein FimL second domain-containing protein n=1 Tax=Bacterioplanes sanyensis TaxID=1249553 RepID=A0A222FL33_9GAMM|nr:hypothetical protein CHH28_13995 [Bacterioplanes sanyensis]